MRALFFFLSLIIGWIGLWPASGQPVFRTDGSIPSTNGIFRGTPQIQGNAVFSGSSNYVNGVFYFGGGAAVPRFTNGFVVFDSIEHYFGDYILFNGGEFIGVHRGDGQYMSNIPPSAIQQAGASIGEVLKWDGAQWAPGTNSGGGSGAQTPWTAPINAATFTLTNLGSIVQTGAPSTAMLQQTVKRPVPGASHTYEALKFHYGGLSNLFWSWKLSSATNTLDPVGGSWDHQLQYGFNLEGTPDHAAGAPTFGYGFEENYTTALGVRQMEHYMNMRGGTRYTNHARPWGWSAIFDDANNKMTMHHSWNIEQVEVNASNGLPSMTINQSGTNATLLTLQRDSQLTFTGNTHPEGKFITDASGNNLVGRYQYGMPAFGSAIAAASNAVVFAPRSLASGSVFLLLGQTNAYAALRWNHSSNSWEYSENTGGVALDALTFRKFNDQSIYQGSYNVSASLGGTAGDYATLGFWTNNNESGIALLEVTAMSSASGDTLQRWLVPITFSDQQASASTWYEVLPEFRAGRFTTNHIGVSLDVSGSAAAKAMNLRLRRVDASSSSTITVTVNAWAQTRNSSVRFYVVAGTGSGATVAGYYRHTRLTQINGRVGIGTNNPAAELHVIGNAIISGTITATGGAITNAHVHNPTNQWSNPSGTIKTRYTDNTGNPRLDFLGQNDVPQLSIFWEDGPSGGISAPYLFGNGSSVSYNGAGNNGNLATSVNTLQELNDAVDNLSLSGGSATNGISYANVAWPAFRTVDNDFAQVLYTNGVPALSLLNPDQQFQIHDYNSNAVLIATTSAVTLSSRNGDLVLDEGFPAKKVLRGGLNTRELFDEDGTLVLSFMSTLFDIKTNTKVNGDLEVTGDATFSGETTVTNLVFDLHTITLFETNAALKVNAMSFLEVTNHVRFTNWASVPVSGGWFNVFLTNSTGNNLYVDVPTNGFTRNMTNGAGCYVVADASGTNFACLLTNGQRARFVGEFVGGNLNAGTFYFRHW